MKVFVAGGTGVIGKRLVPLLLEKGYEVSVLTRSDENKKLVEGMGGHAKAGSLFDLESLKRATEGSDVVLHLATSIPRKAKTSPNDWQMNSRLRIEGTKTLMDAAIHNKVSHYIQQSVTFAYGHREKPIDGILEPTLPVPTKVKLPPRWQTILDNPVHMETLIEEHSEQFGMPYTILRFGWFYSHDSTNIQDIYSGNFAHIWGENPFWSMIHVDDAASAILKTIEQQKKVTKQKLNVVDDLPVRSRDFLDYTRATFGKGRLRKVPGFLVRLLFGPYALNFLTSSLQVSNEQFRQITGWRPSFPTYIDGIEEVAVKISKGKD